ncbi:protein of unknown function [Aminobacter niigataensis]|nr:protein of unknown function [Aminobacter niigataensis]
MGVTARIFFQSLEFRKICAVNRQSYGLLYFRRLIYVSETECRGGGCSTQGQRLAQSANLLDYCGAGLLEPEDLHRRRCIACGAWHPRLRRAA